MMKAIRLLALANCAALLSSATLQGQALFPAGSIELEPEPTVVLGPSIDGLTAAPELTDFHLVAGAVRLSDGRFVVADRLFPSRVTVFSAAGQDATPLSTDADEAPDVGLATSLVARNDTLYIFDEQTQRLHVVPMNGGVLRSIDIGYTGRRGMSAVVPLSDNTWVARETGAFYRKGQPAGLARDTVAVGLFDESLEHFEVIDSLPGRMSTTNVIAGRRTFRFSPFSPRAIVAQWGRCVFTSATESSTVGIFASDGHSVGRLVGPGEARPLTEEHVGARLAHVLDRVPVSEAPIRRRVLLAEARPANLPYYNQVLIDTWGHLWFERFEPARGVSGSWSVFSQDGQHLWDIQLPRFDQVFVIGPGGVMGRAVAEDGSETVQVFGWERPPAASARVVSECVRPKSRP